MRSINQERRPKNSVLFKKMTAEDKITFCGLIRADYFKLVDESIDYIMKINDKRLFKVYKKARFL